MKKVFETRLEQLENAQNQLITLKNKKQKLGNRIFDLYENPVLTAAHTPLFWRYDLNPETNPFLMERFGINATFNAGAVKWQGKYVVAVRVEGMDRKSFFAIAESPNGIDNFQFWDYTCTIPKTEDPDFKTDANAKLDMFNVVVGIVTQCCLTLLPMYFILSMFLPLGLVVAILAVCAFILKKTWWNKLQAAQEDPSVSEAEKPWKTILNVKNE